ncbi:MAG: PPOX class F420-dependent oxidoreductase [Roseiflexaceae bacterium]|nr:PPOX class F420-dependent oxidoreductase [Roseiflexaceae bacterium]
MTHTLEPIPVTHHDLLNAANIMSLATVLKNGTPQVTPVWFSFEDGFICFNTAVGRLKDRAIRANPYVAITIVDPQNMYRYIAVRGPVEIIDDRAIGRQHINELSAKYTGDEIYSGPADEPRVKFRLAPEFVQVW